MNIQASLSATLFCSAVLIAGLSQAQPVAQSGYSQQPANAGLAAALQAVIENNPSIKGKMAELEAQGYAVDTSKAARYPSMSVSANNISDTFGDQGTVSVQQPLYAFGKIYNGIAEAEAGYSAEQWDLLRVQRQLIEEAAVAYVSVSGVKARAQVADLNTQEHSNLYERIERRERGQLASEADVRIANSRLIQARADQQRLKGELQIALAELRALTLINVSTDTEVNPALAQLPGEQSLQALAQENSADLGFRKEQIELVRLSVKSEKLDILPTVYLRAEYDFLDQRVNADPGRVGVAIEGDIDGFGFGTRGRIKGAAARLNAAEQQLSVSLQELKREVSVLVANYQTQLALVSSQKEAVDAVEATLESFIRQYETGRKSWVDVLNTQRELTNLRFGLVEFETDSMIYALRLQALTGGLDQMASVVRP